MIPTEYVKDEWAFSSFIWLVEAAANAFSSNPCIDKQSLTHFRELGY